MISENLRKAAEYEKTYEKLIKKEDRPSFHLTPRVGWMNDPNGFSFFGGKYHMFYQYYPYNSKWGPMHWGHAVSEDMLHWEYLPVALAPDSSSDNVGCFSGSAVDMGDGRHLLVYTGVMRPGNMEGLLAYEPSDLQVQCVAIGDGIEYAKYEKNPVIDASMLPEGGSKLDFRDPKVWKLKDGTYCCVVGNRPADGSGQLLLFTSQDGLEWKYKSVLAENKCRFGTMWECPDFFELDGKWVMLTSPCDMVAADYEFVDGSGTLCMIGEYDESKGKFIEEAYHSIEYGVDFYAPQTILTKDGRRVMIGWMQNWKTLDIKGENEPWFGQMTIPRELHIKDNRLLQWPAKELDACRTERVEYKNVTVSGEKSLEGVAGRIADIEMTFKPAGSRENVRDCDIQKNCVALKGLEIRFAQGLSEQNVECYTSIIYNPKDRVMTIDRTHSGVSADLVNSRSCKLIHPLKNIRMILDRFSAEVFVNDGEEAMSITMYTDQSADGITFIADGIVEMDVVKYCLG